MPAEGIDRRDRLAVERVRPVRVGAAGIDLQFTEAPALPVLTREHRTGIGGDDGLEGHVLIGVEHDEVRNLQKISD